MIRRNAVLIGLVIGVVFLMVATVFYPGGTNVNEFSQGYDWRNNYISNLLSPLAVNGMDNTARPWAMVGVLFLTTSFGLFFVAFSKRIRIKSAAFVIKYFGITATALGFLTVFPSLHDTMVTLSSMLTLIIFFYITVILLKSELQLLKWLSVLFLMTFYFGAYMYFTRSYLEFMPLMQKVIFLIKIVWVLTLTYLTKKADFEQVI
jgi:hypothetical protein